MIKVGVLRSHNQIKRNNLTKMRKMMMMKLVIIVRAKNQNMMKSMKVRLKKMIGNTEINHKTNLNQDQN